MCPQEQSWLIFTALPGVTYRLAYTNCHKSVYKPCNPRLIMGQSAQPAESVSVNILHLLTEGDEFVDQRCFGAISVVLCTQLDLKRLS